MKKKIILILLIFLVISSLSIIYLNQVILPIKIKSLIISELEKATQKKVSLKAIEFNIFKGLVLKNLNIYNETRPLLNVKECSFTFLILPIFKKNIVIPTIKFNAPIIFLERRSDNTINLKDLFPKKMAKPAKPRFTPLEMSPLQSGKAKFLTGFNLFVYKVSLKNGRIDFQDDTLSPEFTKTIDNVNLILSLSLPASMKFKLSAKITANPSIKIQASGEFRIVDKELISQVSIKDFSPAEFSSYYKNFSFYPPSATLDCLINLILKNDTLTADFVSENILGMPVKAKFNLTDFKSPIIQLALSSSDWFLESGFMIKDKFINISKFNGQYINSKFLIQANIDTSNVTDWNTVASGTLSIDLKDIKGFLKKFPKQWDIINPSGMIDARFNFNGNLNNIKSSLINLTASSPSISIYGLKPQDLSLNYNQENGVLTISSLTASLYDGAIETSAKMNLNSENLPFWIDANVQGIKIEKLKLDTPLKEKDISGNLMAELKLNGFSKDLSKLNGKGEIFITDGILWQLNLFKGLGELLFAKDFANIVFSEGYSGFIIQDKYISSDDLKLKSNFVNLSGSYKIGFDSSVDASVNIEVLDEFTPLSGTFKDFTTAIIGEAGRFGVINISGTLREPKYKFKPAVADIIKGLKDIIWGKE